MPRGGRRPGAGRKPGMLQIRTQEGEAFAKGLITDPDYVQALKARLKAGRAPQIEALLIQLAFGKPIERHVVEGNPDAPLALDLGDLAAKTPEELEALANAYRERRARRPGGGDSD